MEVSPVIILVLFLYKVYSVTLGKNEEKSKKLYPPLVVVLPLGLVVGDVECGE